MLALAVTVAIVVQDPTPLMASPEPSAARQAILWRGDWLEVRGELRGRLKVYDHRHERPGYVEPWQVRTFALDEGSAPALRAVIDFVRDTPGAESLGIGVAALYLKVAPAAEVGADVLGALGGMAERLARRASGRARPGDATAEHLEVAQSYGIGFVTVEADDGMRVCYDGEAYRHVLALPAGAELRARAALGLTDPRCRPPGLGPTEEQALVEGQIDILARAEKPDASPASAAALWRARVRLRRAGLLATLAYLRARRGDGEGAAAASGESLDAFAGVARAELAPEDEARWNEAALRVAAARWLREPAVAPSEKSKLRLELAAGKPGETCVKLIHSGAPQVERCTYGLVAPASTRIAARGNAVAVAVQPLPGWLELWLFRRAGDGWIVDVVPPSETDPELGYAELAGFSPDGTRVLVVREARSAGVLRRSFERRLTATLAIEKSARSAEILAGFDRWSAPDWRRATLALR